MINGLLIVCFTVSVFWQQIDTQSHSAHDLHDTSIVFLWWQPYYDVESKDSLTTMVINEEYCKTISDYERAAIGYASSFIGSECWWDGDANKDYSNLKCKVTHALNLGYQCSEQHLGFLRHWFRNDRVVLDTLSNCSAVPYGATIQNHFNDLSLLIADSTITVVYNASGINTRDRVSWQWSDTLSFRCLPDEIRLVRVAESKVIGSSWEE